MFFLPFWNFHDYRCATHITQREIKYSTHHCRLDLHFFVHFVLVSCAACVLSSSASSSACPFHKAKYFSFILLELIICWTHFFDHRWFDWLSGQWVFALLDCLFDFAFVCLWKKKNTVFLSLALFFYLLAFNYNHDFIPFTFFSVVFIWKMVTWLEKVLFTFCWYSRFKTETYTLQLTVDSIKMKSAKVVVIRASFSFFVRGTNVRKVKWILFYCVSWMNWLVRVVSHKTRCLLHTG